MTLPTFLIAGERRCGTTSLYRWMQGHPKIYLHPITDINYFISNELTKSRTWKNGKVDYQGDVVQAIQHYSRNILNVEFEKNSDFNNKGWVRIFVNDSKEENRVFNTESFEVTADLALSNDIKRVTVNCFIHDAEGNRVVHNENLDFKEFEKGIHRIKAQIPPLYLKPGVYTLFLKFLGETQDASKARYFSERLVLDISDKTNMFHGKVGATILPPIQWTVSSDEPTKAAFV